MIHNLHAKQINNLNMKKTTNCVSDDDSALAFMSLHFYHEALLSLMIRGGGRRTFIFDFIIVYDYIY